jgi:ribosome-binding protein aMBF1 (putative translation factor)
MANESNPRNPTGQFGHPPTVAKQISTLERDVMRRLGAAVIKHRKLRGISRTRLGELLGQSADSIAKMERGERRFTVADVLLMANEFECSADELINGDGPKLRVVRKTNVEFG